MTLDEAFQVAKAVGDCVDPPVIREIFTNLNDSFPDYDFSLSTDLYFTVWEKQTGNTKTASIFG